MKKINFILICIVSTYCYATSSSFYVFAKSGLNLRAEANTSAKVLTTIAYGEEVSLLADYIAEITIDHLKGYWVKVKYKTFTGYLVNTYLLPNQAPQGTTRDMTAYIAQVTSLAYKTEVLSSYAEGVEGGLNIQKTFYHNGMELHYLEGSESTENIYFLPFWKKENAFLLLKSLTEFQIINEFGIEYPSANKVYKKGDRTVEVNVLQDSDAFSIYYLGESITTITISEQGNQIVISIAKEA